MFIIGERPTQEDIISTLLMLYCDQYDVEIANLRLDGVPYEFDKTKGIKKIGDKTA